MNIYNNTIKSCNSAKCLGCTKENKLNSNKYTKIVKIKMTSRAAHFRKITYKNKQITIEQSKKKIANISIAHFSNTAIHYFWTVITPFLKILKPHKSVQPAALCITSMLTSFLFAADVDAWRVLWDVNILVSTPPCRNFRSLFRIPWPWIAATVKPTTF